VIHELRSYAGVLVDGKHTGTLDRRKKDDRLDIEVGAGSTLDVLVEGTGRINSPPNCGPNGWASMAQ
jgi:beta-galactosidase